MYTDLLRVGPECSTLSRIPSVTKRRPRERARGRRAAATFVHEGGMYFLRWLERIHRKKNLLKFSPHTWP